MDNETELKRKRYLFLSLINTRINTKTGIQPQLNGHIYYNLIFKKKYVEVTKMIYLK